MATFVATSPTGLVSVVAAVMGSLLLWRRSLRSNTPAHLRRSIPSPRKTLLPLLSPTQADALAYPPDLFPGARDVETHYGSMRIYEWGPEHGRKILFVHGDTTPGPMFAPIAESLVKKGCRVMIIGRSALPSRFTTTPNPGIAVLGDNTLTGETDLWGRGYSDTPLDVPHDSRLFSMQIFFAVASSPLSWTGTSSGGFSIIAFSLGGGITVSFAAHYPYLVNSIILLAPAGILRCVPDEYESIFFRYSSVVPSKYLRRLIGSLLGVGVSDTAHKLQHQNSDNAGLDVPHQPVVKGREKVDIPAIVQWQFDFHQGFCHSFLNTIAHGPIMHQQSDWKRFGNVIHGNAPSDSLGCPSSRLRDKKILIVFGESDSVVNGGQVSEDLIAIFGGSQHFETKTVEGGHGFPFPSCDDVLKHIYDFWMI
ncbi:MAG: hypothetical protein Q9168_004603 [Polycauliona sp. 1 TL-2023]